MQSPSHVAPYRTQPIHVFPRLPIQAGHASLATQLRKVLAELAKPAVIIIDGFIGMQWQVFLHALSSHLLAADMDVCWLSTEECFLSPAHLDAKLAPFLTDDPVFGCLYHGHLDDVWDTPSVEALKAAVAQRTKHTIVYGFGASLIARGDYLIYADVPKDRSQHLAASKQLCNLGAKEPEPFGAMYKRMYFIEWPLLNRIKRTTLPHLDLFVDATDSANPVWVDGSAFRETLHTLAYQPLRVKPWFAPGPWGGQWMKEHFDLPREQPNYAWSFELIAPENGLLFGNGERTFECSFDYLLWQEADAVLGTAVAARYGSYFPIRFDYLDTMGGTNLSCQVHPRVDYIRDEFGEPFTQDETYYIVTCEPDARVFLGLHDTTSLEDFRADAQAARDQKVPFDIEKHVNSIASQPHDLFLIPSGTVHCSGANNLVLEISATPYIYTFKIYDYLRSDLNGNLRHVHLDHAFANIDATRRASWVREHLRPQPTMLRAGTGWAEYRLANIEHLFFAIHRLEFEHEIEDETAGRFLALNLVEGERCEIHVAGKVPAELRFAESLVLPASVGSYSIQNTGVHPCKIVKAFVKI